MSTLLSTDWNYLAPNPRQRRSRLMPTHAPKYRDQVLAELAAIPAEYLPFVLQMVRTFRESVALKPAKASFRQGWKETQAGETSPASELWEGIDDE